MVEQVPHTAPETHHKPAVEVEKEPRCTPVSLALPWRYTPEDAGLYEQHEETASRAVAEADPGADGGVGGVEVDILQTPRAAPVENSEREEDEETQEAVDSAQQVLHTRHHV